MTPYISGNTAMRMEQTMSYDPVNFKRMQLDPCSCQIRVLVDQKRNAMFEVLCDDVAVMAFLYADLRPWELNQRRDAFSRLFKAGRTEADMVYFTLLPTQSVAELPVYPMWRINSTLGETEFWATSELWLSVKSTGHKMSLLSVAFRNNNLASFQITGCECDDDEVLDAAATLRTRLRLERPVRVETFWEQEKLVWFYPANHFSAR